MIRVVIEQMDMDGEFFHIYDESGQAIEVDFLTYEEAETWAKDNNYIVVSTFNI